MKTRTPFTIYPRLLVDKAARIEGGSDVLHTWTLTEIRDQLLKMERLGKPKDSPPIHLSQMEVSFTGGVMTMQRKVKEGEKPRTKMRLFNMAASHLQSDILPSGFWSGFKELVNIDPDLAKQVWMKFAGEHKTPRIIRTILIKERGEVHRVIRAMVSETYARYSHVKFVQDILESDDYFATLPVLSWSISDSGMRIRFLGIDETTDLVATLDPDILMEEPLPCVEIWNSETRQGAVACAAGAYNARTKSSFGHWDYRATQKWAHRGKASRMAERVQTAFPLMTEHAAVLIEAYKLAQKVGMEDPEAWLKEQLGEDKTIPDRVLETAVSVLTSDLVTPGGKLATVIDALTVAAAQETNLFTRSNVEAATARILRSGNYIAEQNGGVIPADEEEPEDQAAK